LNFDGSVKVINFTSAKSVSNYKNSKENSIKKMLNYLAPEYLEDKEIDATYDQFALGIILWEMLCGQKLFKGNSELEILKKIQDCKIPRPSSINPLVSKELDEIVLRALSKDRNDRYENLDQMNRELTTLLYKKYQDFTPGDLRYLAHSLFEDEIKKDRDVLFEFGKIDLRPYMDVLRKCD
jgi:serine/threonine-protein kinase